MKPGKGKIAALSLSSKKGGAKSNVAEAVLLEEHGFEGDAHGGPWHRQVSLLGLESVRRMIEKGADVRPGSFGENITTESIDLSELRVGDRLAAGGAELEITQLGKECHTPCAIYERVGDCVMPREGIFARVLRGGTVRVGDAIQLQSEKGTRQDG